MFSAKIKLTRKDNTLMEHIALFTKGVLAIVMLGVCFSSIYIYRVWSRDTSRRVKIGIMGFTIELGPSLPGPEKQLPEEDSKIIIK